MSHQVLLRFLLRQMHLPGHLREHRLPGQGPQQSMALQHMLRREIPQAIQGLSEPPFQSVG